MKSPLNTGAIRDLGRSGPSDRHNTQPESPQQSYRVTCLAFRVFEKATLRGFATLHISPPGMELHGCTAHSKSGKRWINPPAQKYTNKDGGTAWQNLVTIDEGKPFWLFQELACGAIDAFLEEQGITTIKDDAGVVVERLAPEQRQHMGEITSGPKEGNTNEFPF